jgi:hypothetical protein
LRSSAVESETWILPGSPVLSMRAAVLTVSPNNLDAKQGVVQGGESSWNISVGASTMKQKSHHLLETGTVALKYARGYGPTVDSESHLQISSIWTQSTFQACCDRLHFGIAFLSKPMKQLR